jgi:hypothetical protein
MLMNAHHVGSKVNGRTDLWLILSIFYTQLITGIGEDHHHLDHDSAYPTVIMARWRHRESGTLDCLPRKSLAYSDVDFFIVGIRC